MPEQASGLASGALGDPGHVGGSHLRRRFEQLLADDALQVVFQPVVELQQRRVVGCEALTRGPAGTALEDPATLFAVARDHGRVDELDWRRRRVALRRALAHRGFTDGTRLFLDVEPETLARPVAAAFSELWSEARDSLALVLEVTERALTADPAGLLRAVADVRERGWGVALDDVGADLYTLALLPLVRPDVIKLDMRVLHERPTAEIAAVVSAVALERELTGATVLAEGVEDEEHVLTASALGATLALQAARKALLLALSEHLERQAVALGAGSLVIGTFQEARYFGAETEERYKKLADAGAFVAAFAPDLDTDDTPSGVRGGQLTPQLAGEWNVVVIGHHFGAVLAAHEVDAPGTLPEDERRFDFVLTHDRQLAVESARLIMDRIAAVSVRPALST